MTTTNKQSNISAMILACIASGMTVDQAFDEVMGEGAYAKMAGDVYDALQAK